MYQLNRIDMDRSVDREERERGRERQEERKTASSREQEHRPGMCWQCTADSLCILLTNNAQAAAFGA